MSPEKHGINMGLKNMSDLREFESLRVWEFERERERERESLERVCLREFYVRYYNVIFLVL